MTNRIIRILKSELKRIKYENLFKKYKRLIMVPKDVFIGNLECIDWHKVPNGNIVECGVWRGGMIAVIAEMLGNNYSYYLFDSFEGLPKPVAEEDGGSALEWYNKNEYDNCKADIHFAKNAMAMAKAKNVFFVKGWFSDTIPVADIDTISVLRIDSDWYESVKICLDYFFPKIVKGGILIIDDYYMWERCRKAVHQYMSVHNQYFIREWKNTGVFYIYN